jgi:RNA polymerase sigma-70 factor, ECF subfamily
MRSPLSEAEIRAIYRATIGPLYGYVSRKCGGERALAEDITQETWLRAVREWPRIGLPENPIAWLTTVARNLVINHHRKREHVPLESISADTMLEAVERDEPSRDAEIAGVMTRALATLPTEESQLLEAFHYERKKVSQLAIVYGITERAVEGRLRRAREHLRTALNGITSTEGSIL